MQLTNEMFMKHDLSFYCIATIRITTNSFQISIFQTIVHFIPSPNKLTSFFPPLLLDRFVCCCRFVPFVFGFGNCIYSDIRSNRNNYTPIESIFRISSGAERRRLVFRPYQTSFTFWICSACISFQFSERTLSAFDYT